MPKGDETLQRVSITRLFKDRTSRGTVLIMETLDTSEEITIDVPWEKAGVLALEAHGLNDRCPLYSILVESVAQLGGSFGPVVLTRDEVSGNGAAISLTQDRRTKWIAADLVELIALALHLQLPIYVSAAVSSSTDGQDSASSSVEIPTVFHETFKEDLLAEREEDEPQS